MRGLPAREGDALKSRLPTFHLGFRGLSIIISNTTDSSGEVARYPRQTGHLLQGTALLLRGAMEE